MTWRCTSRAIFELASLTTGLNSKGMHLGCANDLGDHPSRNLKFSQDLNKNENRDNREEMKSPEYSESEVTSQAVNPNANGEFEGVSISKAVDDLIDSLQPEYAQYSGRLQGRSRRRLYHLRQDVIAKIIFRCFRKFYLKRFKAFFDFSKCRKENNSDSEGEILTQVRKFVKASFGNVGYESMTAFLISVMDIKERHMTIGEHNKQLRENISALLYSFNKIKLANMINNPEFALLLHYFLSQRDIIDQVVKYRNNPDVLEAYYEQIQDFKQM
eukprot:CAMPEP_0168339448 /NCGR_PEP_ID=MMETSP0213-20121227/13459_1 /TAXON_ID=151035 /ORGANISM="Euplotes harpa, Strain FSP1.4" /LENGTH=271 /DNA_ID=CAMNT_0008345465 /DNA_START=335 /DNA_END=1149 /DNA_ORIENTATION=+